ncbi:5'-methylthioadenosine/adenosylhomocysteine nucleosidase [Vagococcus lutrae]|uniref:5'-methylthioadenosine/adenosylhomocysteine nucleosidase n=1 Tax=Vagococcus lutrae TaxID=81947 RepID=UPI00200DC823|nr:5'-methylthioadenosine/adenosylhomocysteine nucleosidase [Vagococcus lutrae]UQF12406.1 5'-methylthioadenosine/adenosylhomocysteine nucleosidase [Vagococcus lutrae]WEB80863.1 5'-methylthioadenosine/adenosylhomocysteine nucleosidase [Vagococcus lutrae]
MKIGIIGAMAEELIALKAAMTASETVEVFGNTFVSGKIGEHDVVVVQSGIGKGMAAMTATLLIDRYQVDMLVNTGSAGGIGEGLKIGDVVVSKRLAYFDVDVTAFGYKKGQMAGMPLYYEADETVMETITRAAEVTGLSVRQGEIVTGDTFVHSQAMIQQIKADFPDALVNEMEGAAIAQVATQAQVPFVVVRAVSDVADEEAAQTFDEFIITAGKRSAEMVLNWLAHA